MLSIPRPLEYALMVLAQMHKGEPDERFQTRALCDQLGLPFDAVAKVFQRMNHHGIVRSIQGKYGGYQMACNLSDVSLGELMQCIMGPSAMTPCLHPDQSCSLAGGCLIRQAMERLDERVQRLFQETRVLELIS